MLKLVTGQGLKKFDFSWSEYKIFNDINYESFYHNMAKGNI